MTGKCFSVFYARKGQSIRTGRNVNKEFLRKTFMVAVTPHDILCNTRRHVYYKDKDNSQSPSQSPPRTVSDQLNNSTYLSPSSVTPSLPRITFSIFYCFICKRPDPKLVDVPVTEPLSTFIRKKVIISSGRKCCHHTLKIMTSTHEQWIHHTCT